MKKLNVTFCSFPDYSCHAKPLYEYMKKRYKDLMNFVWIVRTDEMYETLKNKDISVYKLGSAEYYNYIKKSNVIFTTHGDLMYDKPEKCLYIELWHGIGLKKAGHILENISESDNNWMNYIAKKIDYMIVPTDFWATIFSAIFNIKKNRILTLGYPKFDNLKNKNAKKDLSKILDLDVFKFDKIIYYTPTFQKRDGFEQEAEVNISNLINLEYYNENDLINYLKKNNYLLCVKKHPSDEINYNSFENDNIKIIDNKKLLKNNITIDEILNASDLLISDYSSLLVEYSFLNKPVISINTNIESYSENRGIVFENYDFWETELSANSIQTLLDCFDRAFKDKNYNSVTEKRNLWFGNLKDGGCKQICDYIFTKDGKINTKNIKYYQDIEDTLLNEINNLKKSISDQEAIINKLLYDIDVKDKELENIKNSKGWKLLEKLRKLKK